MYGVVWCTWRNKSVWVDTVRAGVCTMGPELCHWVRCDAGVPGDYGVPMRMVDLFTLLCAGRRELVAETSVAEANATMCWYAVRELVAKSV